MTTIKEYGSTTLVSYGYDDLGRRTSIGRANGVNTGYAYDGASRLTCLAQDLAGGGAIGCIPAAASGQDNAITFAYNPVGQIVSRTSANDAYAWTGSVDVDRNYASNGLNQYTNSGGTGFGYDGRGNLNISGSVSYGYSSDNELVATSTGVGYAHDGLGRLFYESVPARYIALSYDGSQLLSETNDPAGSLARRYVYGPDEAPVVWYEGAGTSDKRWLLADERGSVVAVTNASGVATAINTYDEYGIPGAGNQGRFQYTGQKWLPDLGMYDYKARIYSPTLGRFMQTDPIGYADGPNWYNYVGNDSVNATDPSGTDFWYCYGNCGPGYVNDFENGQWVEVENDGHASVAPDGTLTYTMGGTSTVWQQYGNGHSAGQYNENLRNIFLHPVRDDTFINNFLDAAKLYTPTPKNLPPEYCKSAFYRLSSFADAGGKYLATAGTAGVIGSGIATLVSGGTAAPVAGPVAAISRTVAVFGAAISDLGAVGKASAAQGAGLSGTNVAASAALGLTLGRLSGGRIGLGLLTGAATDAALNAGSPDPCS